MPCSCPCACHSTYDGACSIPGGCGSVGCDYAAHSGASERRCGRGDHCQDREPQRDVDGRHTGTWLPRRIDTARGLCDTCTRTVTYALHHLTGDVVELTMLMARPTINMGLLVASSPELPVPIRLGLEALRAEIDSELQAWAEPVAEVLGVDWNTSAMQRSRLAVRVQRAAHLLANAPDVLLALGEQEHPAWADGEPVWDHNLGCQDTTIRDGVAGALDLLNLHRRAYAAAGRTKLVHRLPTPCPWCDYLTLIRHNGADEVTCENCHKVIEEKHYSWFVAVLVREQQRPTVAA